MEDQIKHPGDLPEGNEKKIIAENKTDLFPLNPNDTLVAGIKIKNKAGGPEMLVVGFTNYYPDGKIIELHSDGIKIEKIGNYGKERSKGNIYFKVKSNTKKLPSQHFGLPENDNISAFYFYRSMVQEQNAAKGSDNLFFVCKRWSDKLEDFYHEIFSIHEVELVT